MSSHAETMPPPRQPTIPIHSNSKTKVRWIRTTVPPSRPIVMLQPCFTRVSPQQDAVDPV